MLRGLDSHSVSTQGTRSLSHLVTSQTGILFTSKHCEESFIIYINCLYQSLTYNKEREIKIISLPEK